jgi:hypothetical protein
LTPPCEPQPGTRQASGGSDVIDDVTDGVADGITDDVTADDVTADGVISEGQCRHTSASPSPARNWRSSHGR